MTDVQAVITAALKAADPYKNVFDAVSARLYDNNVTVVAVGKAAYTMARAAYDVLGSKIVKGFVLTKYGHGGDSFSPVFTVREAGHPVPDENSVKYTDEIIKNVKKLTGKDKLLFLVSGGASAIFESPLIPLEALGEITDRLLKCSADITEINTVRKRLSAVKGGKFALMCGCSIDCIVLSDVLGDRLDVIASGPCVADASSTTDIISITEKYNLDFDDTIKEFLFKETPKKVTNVETVIAGNIAMLCDGAVKEAMRLGYDAVVMTLELCGEASDKAVEIVREAISFASVPHKKTVLIYGGETTVTVRGRGKGGRNQEMTLAAAIELKGTQGIKFVAVGSDGTDGPTDAAGGVADGNTYYEMLYNNICPESCLAENDSYTALFAANSLLVTGPTGTNVNDIVLVFIS